MNLRPQDIAVALRLVLDPAPTYPVLAEALAMSVSETHGAVRRGIAAGLLGPQRQVNRSALLSFLVHGVKHAFVPKRGRMTRGMLTAHGARPLDKLVARGPEPLPVWPDPDGDTVGESFEPLYRNAPRAARKDPRLYELLSLVDALRGGRPRDRALAEERLREILSPKKPAPRSETGATPSLPGFSPETPRRLRLATQLADVGPGPAAFYRDALRILATEPPLATASHVVGHLAREIEGAFRGVLVSTPLLSGKDAHEREIRSILTALDLPVADAVAVAWLGMVGQGNETALHKRAHRSALDAPRPVGPAYLAFWEDFEEILDVLLDAMEKKYVGIFHRLDELLAKSAPTAKDAKVLRGSIPQSQVALGYFFGKAASPEWIEPLRGEGFYDRPPSALQEGDGVRFPRWPALEYLARMAPARPDQVAAVALAVPENDNVVVHETLLGVALALPGHLAARFADKIDSWLDELASHTLVENSAALIAKLVLDGRSDDALRGLQALIKPVRSEEDISGDGRPRARIVEWEFEQTLVSLAPTLESMGEPALNALSDALERAIGIDPPAAANEHWDSSIWQPDIGSDGRIRDFRSLLVVAARDCAVSVINDDPTRLEVIVRDLEARKWTIFRRLAGYLARRFAEHAPQLAADRAVDPYRDETTVRHITGPSSPMDAATLATMTVEELVQAVGRWTPSREFGAAEPAGLSRAISSVVSDKPGVFAAQTHRLEALDPTYLRGVLDGFTNAIAKGHDFAWEPVLELCQWATSQPRQIAGRSETLFGLDAHWGYVRKAVLRLLSAGMLRDKVPIPTELAERVSATIRPTLDDPDPTPELERRRGVHTDSWTVAINSVRGSALEAVVDYAHWTAQGVPGSGLSSEVRATLKAKLADPSAAIRAVYGARFNVLASIDEAWSAAHAPEIFRGGEAVGDSAWESYLRYALRNAPAYRVLRWRYLEAVLNLEDDHDAERISEDLARLFWHQWVDFGNDDGLLEAFFDHASPRVAGRLLERLGRGLGENTAPSVETLERLKGLWTQRAAFGRKEELAAFGWWFSSGRFDDAWSLIQLKAILQEGVLPAFPKRVVERLSYLASDHVAEVVECLNLLWRADERGWSIIHWRAKAPAILQAALASTDDRARKSARALANRLLKAGHEEFRTLAEQLASA